ncbi:hypothetical protein CUMW_136950 [Citrus unshiu]|uniref:Transmembrane 9 superfamily member n=1 Tax=Citrus unshiu TaxID=55188 RepID=A0A2H5PI59_CITUN|nr:hypothetical protein CUMW_136950 [Citrus unshiu]
MFCGPLFLHLLLNTVCIAYNASALLCTLWWVVLIGHLVPSPLLCWEGGCWSAIPRWNAGFHGHLVRCLYIEHPYYYYFFAGNVWRPSDLHNISILFIVFIILLIVTAFITVALTYFQLAAEDHEWWWRSFLCGGSTGAFIYAYCLYYYYARSDMSGFMQTSFFFGYMACICYGFFLMLGTVGFRASLLFVRHIYRSIKCE